MLLRIMANKFNGFGWKSIELVKGKSLREEYLVVNCLSTCFLNTFTKGPQETKCKKITWLIYAFMCLFGGEMTTEKNWLRAWLLNCGTTKRLENYKKWNCILIYCLFYSFFSLIWYVELFLREWCLIFNYVWVVYQVILQK